MPIRNPFGRRAGAQDENIRAEPNGSRLAVEPPGFERVDTVGSKASSLSGKSSRADTGAYKLSGAFHPHLFFSGVSRGGILLSDRRAPPLPQLRFTSLTP